MKKFLIIIIIFIVFGKETISQVPIEVTEQTIKIGGIGEELLMFGFAEGDKIVFSFHEIDGKEIKEIEIIEYPDNLKFSDFKTTKIENKTINANKQAVYKFRFFNSAVKGRICKINIQRIPASEQTVKFNTQVRWVTKQDTVWNSYTKEAISGYDTTYVQKMRKELVSTETKEELILDKVERVHSIANENGSLTSIFFDLPQNEETETYSKRVVSWAYWIGVGEEANKAWEKNTKTLVSLTKGVASVYFTPLGALALGAAIELSLPSIGEDVQYYLTNKANRNLFMANSPFSCYDKGKGIAGYKKYVDIDMCQGTYYMCMANDNMMLGINANVKVIAIVEKKNYELIRYTDAVVNPRYEKKIFKEPIVNSYQVPITGQ